MQTTRLKAGKYARKAAMVIGALFLAACAGNDAGNDKAESDAATFDAIAQDEAITALGTEPFWNGEIANGTLVYSTPELPGGTEIAVKRFAGNGGLGVSGELDGKPLDLAITPGRCSDGMSDRTFPYTATLSIGGDVRTGCAYTDRQPFEGGDAP